MLSLLDDFLVSTASADSRAAMLTKWTSSSNGVRKLDLSYVKLAAVSSAERTAMTAAIAAYLAPGLPSCWVG